ncbi:MAG: hypothetical protein JWO58_407 [Chitinophagaceae bacterium]|nr:hypothetical protein [Chitinophagaceae bacterium]
MRTRGYTLLILCLSFVFVFAKLNTKEEYLTYRGIATDLRSNKFYYVEEHKEIMENHVLKETVIQYRDSAGVVMAKKVIDYSNNKVTPSFEQTDYRDGYTEGVSFSEHELIFKYRKNKSESLKSKTIQTPDNLVVDGGFNYYIKGNWGELTDGETMVFNFAVPSQLDYFSFRLYKESEQKDAVVFRMEPDNFVLRKLVDPIRVTYKMSTKRIVKYEGLSNINDKKGKSYLVKIMYPKVGP